MSRPPFDYMTSCYRKVRYGHEKTANDARSKMLAKGSTNLDVYACRYCGGWHLGHSRGGGFKVRIALRKAAAK
jgi:hypothetical protein